MRTHRISSLLAALLLLSAAGFGTARGQSSVTIPGDFQTELGCPGDWQPDCATTHLTQGPDGIWRGTYSVPAGSWQYKAAIDDSWIENYGLYGWRDGPNIPLTLAAETSVTFYYSHETHWITDNVNSRIVTLVGDFQSELGCAADWDPSCLKTWMWAFTDDDYYYFVTHGLPAGNYEAKVTIGESWDENYGEGGVPGGANIGFTVPVDCAYMYFVFDPYNHLYIGSFDPTYQPTTVTVPGNFQTELGCPGDWMPECSDAYLTFDSDDNVWQGTFDLPAGNWEYKAAMNDSWDENYGLHGIPGGANIPLSLAAPQAVKFYFDYGTRWITDNVNSLIPVLVGDFQSELGCPGDWMPDCLRSWLEDRDGDGIYTFATTSLPAGNYECKVALNESWDENYGAGGVPGGANIPFRVAGPCTEIVFNYDPFTHELTIEGAAENRPPDCSAAHVSIEELWPPNHQLVPVEILGVTDPDGDPVTIRITGVTQDEPVLGAGSGNSCPDAVLDDDGMLSLRAERSGQGNGRTYVVYFTAEDDMGGQCSSALPVCVPHDQGLEQEVVANRGGATGTRACPADPDPQDYDAMGACPRKQPGAHTEDENVPAPVLSLDGATVRGNLATVAYSLPEAADVRLALYDISGRRVAEIDAGVRAAGGHQATWDAGALAPGVYFYRLRAGGLVVSKSIMVLR